MAFKIGDIVEHNNFYYEIKFHSGGTYRTLEIETNTIIYLHSDIKELKLDNNFKLREKIKRIINENSINN